MANSILKTPNGSDSASTYITDPPPLHRLRQRGSCTILHRHRAALSVEDGSQRAQQDEVTRTNGEGMGLLDMQEAYLKNER
jgi:hypothetical protein